MEVAAVLYESEFGKACHLRMHFFRGYSFLKNRVIQGTTGAVWVDLN
jgi:c-di-GMP-related signal transduction protein